MTHTFEIGNVVAIHFDTPSAIGYNGILCEIRKITVDSNGEKIYWCDSINGSSKFIKCREENLTFQSKRHTPFYYGPCIIEIGD